MNKTMALIQTTLLGVIALSQLVMFFYFQNVSALMVETQKEMNTVLAKNMNMITSDHMKLSERLGKIEGKMDIVIQAITGSGSEE